MNSQQKPRTTIRPARPHGWAGAAALGTLAFVALVAVLLPAGAMAASATTVHTIRVTAPYPGTVVSPSWSVSVAGCGMATMTTAPTFHPSTGWGGFSGNSMMSHCTPAVGGDAYVDQSLGIAVPFSVMNGHDRIVEKWSVKAGGGIHLALGTCAMPVQTNTSGYSSCDVFAYSALAGYAYLYDATNGSYIASGTTTWSGLSASVYDYQYCDAGNCSSYSSGAPGTFGFSGTVTWTFTASHLLASHTYEIDSSWYGDEEIYQSSYGATLQHSHGTAWLNAGELGNGLTLSSITVT
jgi:hypothetical protein